MQGMRVNFSLVANKSILRILPLVVPLMLVLTGCSTTGNMHSMQNATHHTASKAHAHHKQSVVKKTQLTTAPVTQPMHEHEQKKINKVKIIKPVNTVNPIKKVTPVQVSPKTTKHVQVNPVIDTHHVSVLDMPGIRISPSGFNDNHSYSQYFENKIEDFLHLDIFDNNALSSDFGTWFNVFGTTYTDKNTKILNNQHQPQAPPAPKKHKLPEKKFHSTPSVHDHAKHKVRAHVRLMVVDDFYITSVRGVDVIRISLKRPRQHVSHPHITFAQRTIKNKDLR